MLDALMDDGSGHDVLHTLAPQRPDVKCVVAISGGSAAAIEEVDDANVEAKLRKPFDIQDLVEAIRKCVGGTCEQGPAESLGE